MKLERQKKLKERVEEAYALFEHCELCPRKCGVNRRKGEKGFCQAPFRAVVFSAHPHFGEEKSLVGDGDRERFSFPIAIFAASSARTGRSARREEAGEKR